MKYLHGIFKALLFGIALTLFAVTPVFANVALPSSGWYAIAHVANDDTLHWINANGEQASIARPTLPGEAANPDVVRMAVSPDGQKMVLISRLASNNLGVGFYDFATGNFYNLHEAQPNEVLVDYSQLAFSFNGRSFAFALRNMVTLEWRVIVFDTATGDAIDVLKATHPQLPDNFYTHESYWTIVTHFGLDEGMGQSYVGLQQVSDTLPPNHTAFPSFRWYHNPVPIVADNPIVPAAVPFSPYAGLDVRRTNQAVAYTGFSGQDNPATNVVGSAIGTLAAANQLPIDIVTSNALTFNSPQWLNDGQWIGYRIQNTQFQPHYAITSATQDTSLPLGPNIGSIHDTPDGFVAVNSVDWQLYHATSLNFEAFSYSFGNVVFDSNGQSFSVIYTTPEAARFMLTSVGTDAVLALPDNPANDVAMPQDSCANAPVARLIVGQQGRVTFTDGTGLNVRTAPAGDFIMVIPEGTVFNVLEGAVCMDGYRWWNIQLLSDAVGGWVAEGDSDEYFVEPYVLGAIDQPELAPTSTPQQAILVPTQQSPVRINGDCSNAPANVNLTIGGQAKTAKMAQTFPLYRTITGNEIIREIQPETQLDVVSGPICHDGFRYWEVSITIGGRVFPGWMRDGYGSTQTLFPVASLSL